MKNNRTVLDITRTVLFYWEYIRSVSYTHLDVYKRQSPDRRDAWKSRHSIARILLISVWSFKKHKKQGRHSERLKMCIRDRFAQALIEVGYKVLDSEDF